MGQARRAWLIPAAAVALSFIVAGVPRARGDSCCKQLTNVQERCNSEGCNGSIIVQQCDDTILGTGTNFQTKQVGCCSLTYPTYYAPHGTCYYGGYSPLAGDQPTVLRTEALWVRSRTGHYVFSRVRVAG